VWRKKGDGLALFYGDATFLALSCIGMVMALTAQNPMFTGAAIGPNTIVNPLWLAYLAPAVYAAWSARNSSLLAAWPRREIAGVTALVFVLAFVTLMVKRWYQGPVIEFEMQGDAESYTISLAWLLSSMVFFGVGIRLDRQNIRYGGLALMVLTILKVFILDFAGLGGLWRIASLLGLGLCLIGVGWLYTRYVHESKRSAVP
jgi:uncharacterized membrane protein